MTEEYNGWTNYHTWLLRVNIDNEEALQNDVCEQVGNGSITSHEALKDYLGEMFERPAISGRNYYFEICDLWSRYDWDSINWYEVFAAYQNDAKELGFTDPDDTEEADL